MEGFPGYWLPNIVPFPPQVKLYHLVLSLCKICKPEHTWQLLQYSPPEGGFPARSSIIALFMIIASPAAEQAGLYEWGRCADGGARFREHGRAEGPPYVVRGYSASSREDQEVWARQGT